MTKDQNCEVEGLPRPRIEDFNSQLDALDLATDEPSLARIHDPDNERRWNLESLVLAIHAKNLRRLKEDSLRSYKRLADIQADNQLIQKLRSTINAATDEQGNIDFDRIPNLEEILQKARDSGIELPIMQGQMTAEKRMRVLEDLKMHIDANNIEINMATNEINNLHFILQESYQWMRSHLKTLDDTKKKIINNISGR